MVTVDLRSDTVTHPTAAMRAAMAAAEVGDDVFGEDPTVNRLEQLAAATLGKEAAVFVPSGTMANLTALLAHCRRGDEVILGDRSHAYLLEAGGSAAVGGIHPRPLPNLSDGSLDLEAVEAAVRPNNTHHPVTRLICLENTHNRCGGAVLNPQHMREARELADRHALAVHVDGARLFNAAVAVGVPAAQLVAEADSVGICLSKGLAAPVGSLVCGTNEFIFQVRRARKLLGGGMRQAGVIAAAGIVALETMVDRLGEDHIRARRLAEGLAALPGIRLDPERVRTNIVLFELDHVRLRPKAFEDALRERGVLLQAIGGAWLRALTHYEIDDEGVAAAIAAAQTVLGGRAA